MVRKEKKIYGLELILELFDCDLDIITSKSKIEEFIVKICKVIKMKRFGKALIKRFQGGGYFGKGFSFFQFITTSSIVGHFIEKDKIAFLNIFSCNIFDYKKAADFAKKFFKAKKVKIKIILH